MGKGDDAAVEVAGQPAETGLHELAHLAAVVLVSAVCVSDGVDDDELFTEAAR